MKRLFAALVLTGLCFASAEGATQTIRIRGYVPVICRADFLAAPAVLGDGVQLGTLNEFCNAGSGYRIVADYTQGLDPGVLMIDGQAVPLGSSGQAVLAVMDGPRAITQSLAYRPGTTPVSAIHITLQPL